MTDVTATDDGMPVRKEQEGGGGTAAAAVAAGPGSVAEERKAPAVVAASLLARCVGGVALGGDPAARYATTLQEGGFP